MLAFWSLLSVLAVAGVRASTPDEELKGRPQISSYPGDRIDNDLIAHLQLHTSGHVLPWTSDKASAKLKDSIPRVCYEHAKRENLDPKDVLVYTIGHDDCGMVHQVCRHKDAEMSIDKMAVYLGRMPVKLRSLVQHLLAVPGSPSAYYAGDIIVYRNDLNLGSFYHEFGHALDNNCPFPDRKDECHETQAWTDAFRRDSHVTDGYARSNQGENFAQISVHSLYDINVPGGLAGMRTQTDGIDNYKLYDDELNAQKQYCREYLTANDGATCGVVFTNLDYVSKTTGEKVDNPYN